jgi:hypothetical protein
MEPIAPEETAPARGVPLGVVVLAGVRLLDAVVLAAAVAGVRSLPGDDLFASHLPGLDTVHAFEAIAAVLSVVVALGLLLRQRWGWTGTMLITGVGLFIAILAFVGGAGNDLRLLVLVASAFYLNQRAVRDWFWSPRS